MYSCIIGWERQLNTYGLTKSSKPSNYMKIISTCKYQFHVFTVVGDV